MILATFRMMIPFAKLTEAVRILARMVVMRWKS